MSMHNLGKDLIVVCSWSDMYLEIIVVEQITDAIVQLQRTDSCVLMSAGYTN